MSRLSNVRSLIALLLCLISFVTPLLLPSNLGPDRSFLQLINRRSIKPTPALPHNSLERRLLSSEAREDVAANSLGSGAGSFEHAHEELFKVVPEVTSTHLALSLLPAFIVLFGSFSAIVKERLYLGEAIIAVVFGIILGPYVSGVFDPRAWGGGGSFDPLTLELTRIVIALSVFAVGVELPKAYILRHWRSMLYLLGPTMLAGWLISGALIYALIPALNFLQALVVAAAVTPTDPILAASVVGKGKYAQKHVPAHLRHLLQAESGCNDGAAFPFLYLAMFLLLRGESSIGSVIGNWILLVILYQIVLGTLIGVVIGIAARKTLKFCKRRSMIDRESMVAMYVALALLTTGLTTLAGSDDLLAAFACGTAFAWDDWFTESIETSNFSSIVDLLINCAMFIYVGATIPFEAWNDSSLTLVPWRLVILGLSILLLRRLPTIYLLHKLIPDLKTHREAIFCGHFGPIGVGAIFISTLAASKLPTPSIPPQTSLDILSLTVQPLIYLLVLFSILIHGLSIPFFTLGRNVHSRVHSMTRTWTQASGNEPSWLSRVKRVDRMNDMNLAETEKADELPPSDGSPATEQIDNAPSEDQVTRVGGETPPELAPSNLPDSTQIGADTPIFVNQDSPSQAHAPSLAPLVPSATAPSASANNSSARPLGSRSALLRLGSSVKRTAAEQEAHRREKLARDEWCRRERVDVAKKGEERVYKCGRHIIIERGDGDEVEVRDIDPPPKASLSHSKRDLKLGLSSASKTDLGKQEGASGASRKLEAARQIVHRSLGKGKAQHHGPHHKETEGLPGPGEGPQASSSSPKVQPWTPEDGGELGQLVWVEGHKIVTETSDGEVISVESIPATQLKPSHSLPSLRSRPSATSAPAQADPPSTEPQRDEQEEEEERREEPTAIRPLVSPEDDDWEEEEQQEDGGSTTPTIGARSGSKRRSSSRRARWVHYHNRSSSIIRSMESLPKSRVPTTVSGSKVGFVGVSTPTKRVVSRPSTGRSSPSRSIRFVEQVDLPDRGEVRKKKKRSGKTRLLSLVSPTSASTSRKSSASGADTPTIENSQTSSFILGNGQIQNDT